MASIAALNQHVATLLACMVGFAIGVTLGWSSLANVALTGAVDWDFTYIFVLINIITGAAGLGSFIIPVILMVTKLLPHKWQININAAYGFASMPLLFAGWIIICVADTSFELLLLGRVLNGLGIGSACVLVPLYISEICTYNVRDALLAYFHALLSTGVFCAYGVATFFTFDAENNTLPLSRYSLSCALLCLPALLFCITPPSLYQLMAMHRDDNDAAREALRRLKGCKEGQSGKEVLDREIERVRTLIVPRSVLRLSRNKSFWIKVSVVTFIMICQQFSGIMLIIFNVLTVLNLLSTSLMTSGQLSLICGGIQLVFSMFGVLLIEHFGRRVMLTASSILLGCLLFLLGWYINTKGLEFVLINTDAWIPPVLITVFFGIYNLGIGPITWSLLADSFPIEIRYLTVSIIVGVGWFLSCALNFSFFALMINLGIVGILWMFAGFMWLNAIASMIFVHESKGKTLIDIQKEFQIS